MMKAQDGKQSQMGLMFTYLAICLLICLFCRVTEETQVLKDWLVLWVQQDPQVLLALLETQGREENR